MKSITRRALLTIRAGFSFFNPAAVLSAKEKELAIFYSFLSQDTVLEQHSLFRGTGYDFLNLVSRASPLFRETV